MSLACPMLSTRLNLVESMDHAGAGALVRAWPEQGRTRAVQGRTGQADQSGQDQGLGLDQGQSGHRPLPQGPAHGLSRAGPGQSRAGQGRAGRPARVRAQAPALSLS